VEIEMNKYTLLSGSGTGPIDGMFVRDPNMRKFRLSDGATVGDTVVRDVDSAARAFADLMARRAFGRKARAIGLARDGSPAPGAVDIFSAHLGCEDPDLGYRGHDVRFAVTVKSDSKSSTPSSA
jgi:hypothetical protein